MPICPYLPPLDVGDLRLWLAVATMGGGAAHCVETAHLGTSTLEGSGDTGGSAKNFRQALIGGTGRFAGAEGGFLIHQISQNDSIVTVQFTG